MSDLVIEDVSVRFGSTLAVDSVDLAVRGSEIVAILGPSGCGKSSLLRAVAGLETLSGGRVLFDGIDQARVPVHRRGFGLMFQDGQLFENLSVGDNVAYGPRRHGASRTAAAQEAQRLLALVGLEGLEDRAPATLSGGQRQRVALARALAPRPGLLLLDEPLSALDASLRVRLAGDVRRVLRETATLALLVTHDHEEAFAIADRVVLMRDGRFVQSGSPREVWSSPVDEDAALFLGYARVLRGDALAPLRNAYGVGDAPLALRANALRARTSEATGSEATGSEATGSQSGSGLRARVVASAPAVDEQRLVVRLDDYGHELDAVGPIDLACAAGDRVVLDLVRSATAELPA